MLYKQSPGTHSGNSTETKSIESQNQIKQQDKSFLAKPQLCCAHAICVSSPLGMPQANIACAGNTHAGATTRAGCHNAQARTMQFVLIPIGTCARDSKADMEPFSLRGYRILSTEILTWFITFEI